MLKKKPVQFFLIVFGLLSTLVALCLVLGLGWQPAIAWLIACNPIALLIWAHDKRQARRGGWRVPERALHAMAFLGATPAAYVGIKVLRHKSLKPHFRILYIVFFVFQLALVFTLAGRNDG